MKLTLPSLLCFLPLLASMSVVAQATKKEDDENNEEIISKKRQFGRPGRSAIDHHGGGFPVGKQSEMVTKKKQTVISSKAMRGGGGGHHDGKTSILSHAARQGNRNQDTSSTCQDIKGWYDSDGITFNCLWYATGSNRCWADGDQFENFGYTAQEACCVCGGGELLTPVDDEESIFRNYFATHVGDQVYIPGTPHDKAARWIIFDDPMKLTPDAGNLLQRYLLTFLYYHSTNNGDDVWRSCNPPGIAGSDGIRTLDDIDEDDPNKCTLYEFVRLPDDSVTYEPSSTDRIRWMSNTFECEWEGVKCQVSGPGLDEVWGVEFFGQRLQGTLPTEIGALPMLKSISFPYNDLTGSIPTTYGTLQHLVNLEVHGNLLTGIIPEEFFFFMNQSGGQRKSLIAFNVGDNLLSGTLSTGIGNLQELKGLHIFDNHLKGNVPTEIGKLGRFLSYIRINGNYLDGPIPSQIGKFDTTY